MQEHNGNCYRQGQGGGALDPWQTRQLGAAGPTSKGVLKGLHNNTGRDRPRRVLWGSGLPAYGENPQYESTDHSRKQPDYR